MKSATHQTAEPLSPREERRALVREINQARLRIDRRLAPLVARWEDAAAIARSASRRRAAATAASVALKIASLLLSRKSRSAAPRSETLRLLSRWRDYFQNRKRDDDKNDAESRTPRDE